MAKYTELRGRVFWFKRRAPTPLKPSTPLQLDDVLTCVGRNGYVKFSLRTSDAREAAKLARKYAHLLDKAAAATLVTPRARRPQTESVSAPTEAEIRFAADTMYATLLGVDEHMYQVATKAALGCLGNEGSSPDKTSRALAEAEGMDGELREPDRFQLSAADLPPMTVAGQAELLRRIMPLANFYLYQTSDEQNRKMAYEVSPELLPFADAFRRYVAALEQRKRSLDVPTPDKPVRNIQSLLTLSALYEKFKTYKTATKAWKDPEVQASREYGPVIREFISVVGDKDVRELGLRDGEKYFEHTMARDDISLGTKKRNFARIKALLHYGGKKHSIPDITGPLEIEASYKKTHQSYERFTSDELNILFHSEAYKKNTFTKASQYWLPILGLYTGARLDELASLRVENVTEINGVWCYFLSSDEANQGGKNDFAPRWVPMHPEVLKAGFLAHWRTVKAEGHERIFPELGSASRDGPQKRATTDFTEYRRSVNVGAMEGRSTKAYHSFRSTLISELIRQKTDDYTRIALLGHVADENQQKLFKGVHFKVYDQTEFDAKHALHVLSKADFKLSHPQFEDTPAMREARARHLRKTKRNALPSARTGIPAPRKPDAV